MAKWIDGARQGIDGERRRESLALGAGVTAFIAAAVVALFVFGLQPAPIAGPNSVGQFAAVASAVVAGVVFPAARILVHPKAPFRFVDGLDLVALAIVHAVVALLSWTLLAVILAEGFIDASVFGLPVVLLAGAAAAVTAYLVFASAAHLDLNLLAILLATFLVEGVIASTLTASDPHWWEMNLSALGMNGDISSLAFNLTLIVAGLTVTTLARYATAAASGGRDRGLFRVRVGLIIIGLMLAMVGSFPVDEHFLVHTLSASGMAVVFGVLVVRIGRWVPGLSRAFLAVGLVFVAVVATLAVLFAVGYYTLTAVELVAGILVFTWIILLLRALVARDGANSGGTAPEGGSE